MKKIKPGIYKHYKGNYYQVHYTVLHSETLEELVLYECLYKNEKSKYWVRPVELFSAQKEWPDGRIDAAFKYVGNKIPEAEK